ncbi:aminotransferase class V-fold PLP-dependent enzyme [Hyphomicrobiales bacterium]|jgi:O-succinylhomoserine sulfhydrylase|nr:aminotransferase class V-fold PLP-dependent enzyme [Rhodobiaceae bacterium]MBT6222728.1 aminotransferase class V-fold PLP-dependent enzyme [Rhodobiaceae bacterium]MDB4127821.1 aminotransferase class V-fold PLP-dependent enzyme [Hyphomicrobiales bacterium]MDB4831413.1 aminotransferase class V-fold PLP-dependent enzyme [Hyphomicrobiales bacterium]
MKDKSFLSNRSIESNLIHGGILRSQFNETSEAIFLTSGYVYNSPEEAEARFKGESEGYIYSRYSNPNITMLENKLSIMEGSEAVRLTSSGMAAVFASLFTNVQSGDHIVAADALFGSSLYILKDLFPKYNIEVTLVRATDMDAWESAIKENTKLFFFETPTNPMLEVLDINLLSSLAKSNNIKVIVDNVFSTPLRQRPLQLGADIVVYSTTKHIDGQGRCLGGAILGKAEYIEGELHNYLKHTGPALSPFNAWVMVKGLETLDVRTSRHIENAQLIAEEMSLNSKIKKLIYPGNEDHLQKSIINKQMVGGGPIVTFELHGGKSNAFKFLNSLNMILISNNLGDSKSLITHPSTTTHQKLTDKEKDTLGITDSILRLSVGLENPNDLIDDISNALNAI